MLYQQKFSRHSRTRWISSRRQHPRFDELADLIKAELDLGFPLDVAYQRADRLRPPMHTAAQTRTQSAQTRKTSISGAPDGGNPPPHVPQTDGPDGTAKRNTQRDARRSRKQCAVSAMACRRGLTNARPARR